MSTSPLPIRRRRANLLGLGICAGLMGYALFAQHGLELDPCPLCVFQRLAVIGLALVFGVAAAHNPGNLGARLYGATGLAIAAGGGFVAGRHVWIQSLPPDQIPACGPGLDYILETFPLGEALQLVFRGSGECATVDWSFLGLSMPAWVLLWLVLLGAAVVGGNWVLRR